MFAVLLLVPLQSILSDDGDILYSESGVTQKNFDLIFEECMIVPTGFSKDKIESYFESVDLPGDRIDFLTGCHIGADLAKIFLTTPLLYEQTQKLV